MNAKTAAKPINESVKAAYSHYDKSVEPQEPLVLSNAMLKWYNLASAAKPVPEGIADAARNFLHAESAAGELHELGELGFVILHRCGKDFYFLLVSSWRNANEVWETVYAKESDDQENFSFFPFPGRHRGTFCVWELDVVWHEAQAWRRFLLSNRTADDRTRYIDDIYKGVTLRNL